MKCRPVSRSATCECRLRLPGYGSSRDAPKPQHSEEYFKLRRAQSECLTTIFAEQREASVAAFPCLAQPELTERDCFHLWQRIGIANLEPLRTEFSVAMVIRQLGR
jgi:hypothetical protein